MSRDVAASDFVTGIDVPPGVVADGGTYGWQTRITDGDDTSGWSRPCYFTSDQTRPGAAPGVTSSTWHSGFATPNHGGIPGTFTFTSGGVADVYAYEWTWGGLFPVPGCQIHEQGIPECGDRFSGPDVVKANGLGGNATVQLVPPRAGILQLLVRSLDRAGNASEPTEFRFFLQDTAPTVTADPPTPVFGQPVTLTFTPNPDVTSVLDYTYRVNNEAARTVAARSDGTASVSVTLDQSGGNHVAVSSRSANGWVSSEASWFVFLTTAPQVSSDVYPEDGTGGGVGVSSTFTFTPRLPDVVEYRYSIDFGEQVSLPAGADGTAHFTFTPDHAGFYSLDVTSVTATGFVSDTTYYFFTVQDNAPTITGPFTATVGVPDSYTFTAVQSGAVEFRYRQYNLSTGELGPEYTVDVGPDGTATVDWAPAEDGFIDLAVRTVDAGGTLSEYGYWGLYVLPADA